MTKGCINIVELNKNLYIMANIQDFQWVKHSVAYWRLLSGGWWLTQSPAIGSHVPLVSEDNSPTLQL